MPKLNNRRQVQISSIRFICFHRFDAIVPTFVSLVSRDTQLGSLCMILMSSRTKLGIRFATDDCLSPATFRAYSKSLPRSVDTQTGFYKQFLHALSACAGDNPLTKASGLSPSQAGKPLYNYTTLISLDLKQYEQCRTKVCDIWKDSIRTC